LTTVDGVQRRAQLAVDGPSGLGTITLARGSSFIGSGENADIRLADETVEAKHLELDWDENELWLIYLGQGIRPVVNGSLVAEAQLGSGDRIELGEHTLTVRILRRTRPGADGEASAALTAQRVTPIVTAPEPEAPPVSLEDPVLLEYGVHLLRDQPRKGAVLVMGLVALFLMMRYIVIPDSPMLLGIAVVVMVGSLGAFLFPLRYRITEGGVELRGFPIRDRKRWSRFVGRVEFDDAVQMVVSQKDLRGRIVKGTLIYYGDQKERVLEIVRDKVPKGGPPKPEAKRRRWPPRWLRRDKGAS